MHGQQNIKIVKTILSVIDLKGKRPFMAICTKAVNHCVQRN
jgi:hypothetical protein